MKTRILLALGVAALAGTGCKTTASTPPAPVAAGTGAALAAPAHKHGDPPPAWWKSSVTVTNASDWTFTRLFMSPASAALWGVDQLRDTVIEPGETFKLTAIDCDTWDLKIVDRDGDECIVKGVDLCVESAAWTLDNDDLRACQVLTKDKSGAR